MTRSLWRSVVLVAAFAHPLAPQARPTDGYHPSARLTAALDSIARARPNRVRVTTLATSPGGRPVHLVRLGDSDDKPALLILANAYGPQLASSEVALRVIRSIAGRSDTTVTSLLQNYTIYVIPRVNPDAAEAFFAQVRGERKGNDTPVDDDNDGATDEDGADDLNGDGLITMMRVRLPGGEYLADSVDAAVMRRADVTKGERGIYKMFVEGRDTDGDEAFNEDGPGGTDVSMNFANNYPWFQPGAGLHQFSASESRAIAQFVAERLNVAAVYVLGMQDNLIKPWEGRRVPGISGNPQGTSAGGPLTAILPEDTPWFAEVSRRFKATTGWSEGPASAAENGDPLSWAYYHMGRLAFGSRAWWPGKAPTDTAAGRKAPSTDSIAEERNAYRWIVANNAPAYIDWKPVTGFMIEGQQVEVGGFAPFALLNPPTALLDSAATKHTAFVLELAGLMPKLTLGTATVVAVGPRVFRVTADVTNDGYFPTNATIGVRSRLPRRLKVELATSGTQSITSGRGVQYIDALRGGGTTERFEWLIVSDAGSTVTLTVGAPNAGTATQTITLRAR